MPVLPLKIMDNILETKSVPVLEDDFGEELDVFMSKMAETMYAHEGIGLAGVQVGRPDRILVADVGYVQGLGYGHEYLKVVNPKILETSDETIKAKEGCLSFPGFEQAVDRPETLLLEYYTPLGERKERFFEGYEARILMHEIDHFEGVTLLNRASSFKRGQYKKNSANVKSQGGCLIKIIDKPWGREEIWALTEYYVGKYLVIEQGKRLSLQHHEEKDETIQVVAGVLELEYGLSLNDLKKITISNGESFHITPKMIHRMTAITDCRILEVSTPQLDDIVRHADDYGRA
jgi:peptide deformylase